MSESANQQNSTPVEQRATDTKILLRAFGYLKPYWHLVAGGYILLLIINGLTMLNPQLIRCIVDRGVGEQDLSFLRWAVLALLGLTALSGVLGFFQGKWIEQASQNVAYDLRNQLYQKLASLSFSYHDRTEAGQLLSRAMQDVDRIRFLDGRATMRLLEGALTFIVTVVIIVLMNPRLAILSLLSMPVLMFQAYRFSKAMRPLYQSIQQQMAVLTTRVEQNLRGMRIVKGFAQEEAEIARFESQNDIWFNLARNSSRISAINNPLVTLIANVSTIFIIWYGGQLVMNDTLTLGQLGAFITYVGQLAGPVRMLGRMVPFIAQAIACGERIFEILDAESEVKESPDAIPLPPIAGHVRFEDVSFAYFGRRTVLDHISLDARPGQIIALLGTTGSGKSTIINLIPRFYDVTGGSVTIDGYDVRDLTLTSLRGQIGIVLQETTLFADTIRNNIAFGRPGATEEEIIEAAKAAQAHEFIIEMPDGYDTPVGERGSTLSGGQKQRVAIARALLKDPRILILDDAMSSVDTETERLIQKALERLMQGRTSFVIAQRLSTIRAAHQILLLDKGNIVAQGTHDDLLRTSGLYGEIYERQLRPQEVAEVTNRRKSRTSVGDRPQREYRESGVEIRQSNLKQPTVV
ncbi:MAG: ABC transporter ATP-binding protein [Anaerolineae bacterium]|nr:ABC transporter ATP-binding protein [Anaerolineae bacterium]